MSIHDHYEVDKQTMIDMSDGIEDWMTATSPSDGSISTERTSGGRAIMDAGNTVGEAAEIQFGTVTPSAYGRADAFGIRFIFSQSDSLGSEASTLMLGLENEGNSDYIRHLPNHLNGESGTLQTSVGGTNRTRQTRWMIPDVVCSSELIWDNSIDELYHRYQNCFAQRITDSASLPDSTQDFAPRVRLESDGNNTSLFLYGVEITYYSNSNPV